MKNLGSPLTNSHQHPSPRPLSPFHERKYCLGKGLVGRGGRRRKEGKEKKEDQKDKMSRDLPAARICR